MDFLSEEEKRKAASCVNNIQDKLDAIKNELSSREKPFKPYMLEKLDSILWDTNCLISMCRGKKVIIGEDFKSFLSNLEDNIHANCKVGFEDGWNEDLFSSDLWNDLWNVTDRVFKSGCLSEKDLNKLVEVENEICIKENEGKNPVEDKEDLHNFLIQYLNKFSDEMKEA